MPVDPEVPAFYFAVDVRDDTVVLGGPEVERVSDTNRYVPTWVPLDQLSTVPLVPDEARRAVQLATASGP